MLASLVVGLLLVAAPAELPDWTQWRGPNRDAVVGPGPFGDWPAELRRRWRVEVGSGQSSPVVAGGSVFVFSRENDHEVARAIDLQTGRLLWRQGYPAPYDVYPGAASYGTGPRSTPVVADGRLFTLGIGGILSAFDAARGDLLWQEDFVGRFPAPAPPFGASMSPLVVGGLLVVHAGGHEGGALIAFEPTTGREKWTLVGDGPSYSSPILTTLLGQEQIVIQVHRRILGVDPAAGRVLWSLPFVTPCDQNIVTPLQVGDRLLVSSLDRGTMAVELTRSRDEWTPRIAWHTTEVSMYMSSPVLAGGQVLGLSHKRKGQYFALDAGTGEVRWTSPAGQGENAALVVAGDSVLVLQGDGTLLVVPRGATSFAPARRYRVTDSATYAHAVPTASGLLVKDETGLSLYATRPAASARSGAVDLRNLRVASRARCCPLPR
jgi:outer membrane protein assembly factor BamB